MSARMSITAFENLLSTAERRALIAGEEKTKVRLSDFVGIIPSITGKVELVYEGEQEGAEFVAEILIDNAVKTLFSTHFPKIEKLQKKTTETAYDSLIAWFLGDNGFLEIIDDASDENYANLLNKIEPLDDLINEYQPDTKKEDQLFLKEFVLWGLAVNKKLNRERFKTGVFFS